MIKRIKVNNFKSLVDFELPLAPLTCLVGLNGAGKSTVLQAIDFLAQLMHGDLKGWLNERQWQAADINSRLSNRSNVSFSLLLELPSGEELTWQGSFNRQSLRCTTEKISLGKQLLLRVADAECQLMTPGEARKEQFPVVFEYEGSILSQLKASQLNPLLTAFRDEVKKVRSLDLLSPELLRLKTRAAEGHLGLGGQRLSAYLHELGAQGQSDLRQRLAPVYQQLQRIETRSLKSGWKQLEIHEQFGDQTLITPARHINDGLLRLMAVLSQLASDEHFLLFDEIENGINPELVEFLVDALVNSEHQVLVTTHSPLILNYLDDATAQAGVIYLYKNAQGSTSAIPLFSIPSMQEKLTVLGPGEAFVDTELQQLNQEILRLAEEGSLPCT